jgi:hypothetical protein
VYTLTDKGLAALEAYARTPVRFTPVKSELLLRLLIADLVGEEVTRESILALRDDIAALQAQIDETDRSAELFPHRRKYLLLVNGFLRELLELHLSWVDELDAALGPRRAGRTRQRPRAR